MRVQTCRAGDELTFGDVRLVILSVHRGKVRMGIKTITPKTFIPLQPQTKRSSRRPTSGLRGSCFGDRLRTRPDGLQG